MLWKDGEIEKQLMESAEDSEGVIDKKFIEHVEIVGTKGSMQKSRKMVGHHLPSSL